MRRLLNLHTFYWSSNTSFAKAYRRSQIVHLFTTHCREGEVNGPLRISTNNPVHYLGRPSAANIAGTRSARDGSLRTAFVADDWSDNTHQPFAWPRQAFADKRTRFAGFDAANGYSNTAVHYPPAHLQIALARTPMKQAKTAHPITMVNFKQFLSMVLPVLLRVFQFGF